MRMVSQLSAVMRWEYVDILRSDIARVSRARM
jgi:hypothetical protein